MEAPSGDELSEYRPRHESRETTSPAHDFGRYLYYGHREVLMIVISGLALVGGGVAALVTGPPTASRLLGLLALIGGTLLLASYALHFFPARVATAWWSRTRAWRGARWLLLNAWAIYLGGLFIAWLIYVLR